MPDIQKTKSLPDIHAYWFHHCTCALKNTATQGVPGVGNHHADIVFIGEAPGKDEDLRGEPFVGRAGKFLSEMLNSINMKREDVYITNTVKYRPPDNRDPSPEEKETCYAWLAEELNYIQPKLIVTLGRHAMNTFLPEAKISDVHGTLIQKKILLKISDEKESEESDLEFSQEKINRDIKTSQEKVLTLSTEYIFPLYHPAAAMYNGALRETLIEDFKKIPAILQKISE
jgi:DNA polymerase